MKRKRFYLLMAVLLAFMAIITGCGGKEGGSSPAKVSGIVPVYTPGAGGFLYIMNAGISKIFNGSKVMPDVQLVTEATNGSADIIEFLGDRYKQGKPAFGASALVDAVQAYEGKHAKIQGKREELRFVGLMNYAAVHMVVPANSPIKSYGDLKGKKVGVAPGSAPEAVVKALLKSAYNIGDGEFKSIPIGYDEVKQGIQNGSIDAGVLMGAIPNPLVKELGSIADIRVLSVEEDKMKKFLDEHAYSSRVAKAGTYSKQDKDLLLPAIDSIVTTHKDADETLVYNYVKTVLENGEELAKIHPAAKGVNPNTIYSKIKIPLHPGAEKYYKEKGILK